MMRAKPFRTRERPRGDDRTLQDYGDTSTGALRNIDRALRELEGRRTVSSAEVVDLLLDLRYAIVVDAEIGDLFDESEVH
jgi:hypothetical protein